MKQPEHDRELIIILLLGVFGIPILFSLVPNFAKGAAFAGGLLFIPLILWGAARLFPAALTWWHEGPRYPLWICLVIAALIGATLDHPFYFARGLAALTNPLRSP